MIFVRLSIEHAFVFFNGNSILHVVARFHATSGAPCEKEQLHKQLQQVVIIKQKAHHLKNIS